MALQAARFATGIAAVVVLVGCASSEAPVRVTPQIFTVTLVPQATPTPTPAPTPTPNPNIALVNERPIRRAEFEAELQRAMSALEAPPNPETPEGKQALRQLRESVLEALIEQALLEQAAEQLNIVVTDQQVEEELAFIKDRVGGEAAFRAWLTKTRQQEADVRRQLRYDLLVNALRDRVLADMPRTAEYVHAYHILLRTEAEARRVLTQLQNGARFSALAQTLSIDDSTRPASGDLGWFTRNGQTIVWPEVEDAAFTLQPGEISGIIKSPVGYHIIKVVAREVRPYTEADLAHAQATALAEWVEQLKANAKIVRFDANE
ncbi:MAG: peptidylprolyl isomerase [Anaerolineae bacterium]|nr:peptidylprolyl isomerase [Anaerolineae bacterium]